MSDFPSLVPMLILALAGVAVMLAEAFRRPGEDMPLGGLGVIGLVGAAVSSMLLWNRDASGFGVIRADNFALFLNLVLVLVGILTVVFSGATLRRDRLPAGEYYALMLFGLAGMMLMAAATDLLVIFLALETLSLAVYVLTGINRAEPRAAEGAFKYFLLGAFSSAFFLYGVAFAFALSGTTHLGRIGQMVAAQPDSPIVWFATGLLLVGFAFKVSAVPFHLWTPDAYQGAPTVVTGFMSTAVKAAAFAAFARVFLAALEPARDIWVPLVGAVAIATMIVGSVMGVVQTNVKRMLAYSSIAHAGYLLIAIAAGNPTGKSALLFYLLVYALTNVGAFGVLAAMATPEHPNEDIQDLAGLWRTHPLSCALMAVFLLSLGGFPPTAGFVGKWYIFSAAVEEGYYGLAIVGVLTSVVSVFYYLRIVVSMYMSPRAGGAAAVAMPSPGVTYALVLAMAGVFLLGIFPAPVLDFAASSISSLF